MAPYADIQSVIDFNDNINTEYSESKAYPLHLETSPRKVSFYKSVAVHQVERACDYSEEERKATWYSIPELRELKSKMKEEVKQLEAGKLSDSEFWSSRGLEGKTTEGTKQKYEARTSAWAVVLLEQDQQDIREYHDPSFLADVYREYSVVSQCLAELRGKQDAKAALQSFS